MKVLFVVFEFQDAVSGGIGRVVNGLSAELSRLVELHVARVFGSRFMRRRLQLHEFTGDGAPRKRGRPLVDEPENLVRLVASEGYDVVHFFCANPILTPKLEALKNELPATRLVFSVHNLFEYERRIRTTTPEFLREEARTLDLVDQVHVLNRSGFGFLAQSYPQIAAEKPIAIIPNGLDPGSFLARAPAFHADLSRRIPSHAAVVSCLSRWAPGKGLEFLIDAVSDLARERRDVFLVLGGRKDKSWETGAEDYVRAIDRRMAALGDRAAVLGWLTEAERNSLFDLTDVCVMPSELEYFSYGCLEPLHQDIPVVHSRLPCFDDLLVDGEHSFGFEPGDSRALSNVLRDVLDDPERAWRIGRQGGERVRAELSWRPIAREYRDMYERTTARASARAS